MYANEIIEPFTVQTFGGVTYAYPLDSSVGWAVNRVKFRLTHGEQPEQIIITAEAFLATTPIECYAPMTGDAQDCLMEYLDTTWLNSEAAKVSILLSDADALAAMPPREYEEHRTRLNAIMGTKYTLDQTRLLLLAEAEHQGIDDWLMDRVGDRKARKGELARG